MTQNKLFDFLSKSLIHSVFIIKLWSIYFLKNDEEKNVLADTTKQKIVICHTIKVNLSEQRKKKNLFLIFMIYVRNLDCVEERVRFQRQKTNFKGRREKKADFTIYSRNSLMLFFVFLGTNRPSFCWDALRRKW